jgi:hypothetical protein
VTRVLLASALALLGTALAYGLLALVLGVLGGWSAQVALDQVVGLGFHAAVVFVRGVLPAVLVTAGACAIWARWRGVEPSALWTLALALPVAALVTLAVLTSHVGDWPRLQVGGALDAALTVLLLTAASAAALLLAGRILRQSAPR